MDTKTLNKKIELVGFWTFAFVFWYLVVAFFLKSEYPINQHTFDLKTAYDVIKDAFTLAAAFLAPVAAFILFSDWRKQHRAQKLELDSEYIIKKINDANLTLLELMNTVCSSDKDDRANNLKAFQLKNEIILKTKIIIYDSARIKNICGNYTDFILRSMEIAELILAGSEKLYDLQLEFQKSDDAYEPNIDFMQPIFIKLESKMDEINKYVLDLQI